MLRIIIQRVKKKKNVATTSLPLSKSHTNYILGPRLTGNYTEEEILGILVQQTKRKATRPA